MLRPTLSLVTLSLCLACTLSCSKNKSEYLNGDDSSPFLDDSPHVSPSAASDRDLLRMAIAAASSRINSDPPEDPSAALECPSTSHWSHFDAFATPCTYAWTTDASQLPSPPEWQPCSDFDDIPSRICKQLKRSRRLKSFALGINSSKEMQLGFVEPCASDQIVLADIDGPTRLAMRRMDVSSFPTTCQMKLLAVDMGQWLGALGGHEVPANMNTSGYTSTGAFIGGEIGSSAPSVLFADSTGPFHVPTSTGSILNDGWIANGKRRHWNGKPIERAPKIGLQRLTTQLLVDEHKGFYSTTKSEPELLLEIPSGHSLSGFQIRDNQIIWQEQAIEHSIKTCTIVTGEIDAHDSLTSPRRMAEIPCTAAKFVLGCNSVLMSNETHLSLLSLSNGSLRTLRVKGHATAVTCKEAFIERAGTLLRIDLQGFGPTKAPSSPPTDLRMRTGKTGTNVLTQSPQAGIHPQHGSQP